VTRTASPRRPAPPFRPPIAFAHRGASAYAPGNTLEAFRLARLQGATGLESDAWLAADGVVVLVHDRTIRSTGRRIDVTRVTSTALAEHGVPTLAALYADPAAHGGEMALSLDIEHPAVAVPAIEIAERAGQVSRLWACHDDLGVLSTLRVRSADVRLVCSTRPRRVEGGVPALIARLAALGLDALNMHWRDWSADLVERCHGVGVAAFGWDAQERAAMDHLLDLGVDALYADAPDRLVAAVTEHATG
jgi:glycerophosphoryl diester phosphodiesterase